MITPFVYPAVAHTRRHGPRGYADYESYRPWLRDEFSFRCVYCLSREMWGAFRGVFALDHFRPIALRPDLALEYDNLLYACASCNLSKGSVDAPDPQSCLLDSQVRVSEDGALVATAPPAEQLIDLLGLNRPWLRDYRKLWIRIIRLAALYDPPLFQRLMGYPDNLPDLTALRPPGGNLRPTGLTSCAFARNERGELPSVY